MLRILFFCKFFYLLKSKVAEEYRQTPDAQKNSSTQAWVRMLGYIASFLIVFINTCLLLCIRQFANVERHSTLTHMNISVAEKLTIAQFCNTALITFLANYAIYHQKYDNRELFTEGGIITDLNSIFLMNAFVPIIMNYCNPWFLLRLYQRWKLEKDVENSFVTQAEANELNNFFLRLTLIIFTKII